MPRIFDVKNTHLIISRCGLCAGECGDGKTNITTIVIVVISTSLVALICMGLYIYYSRKKNQGSIDGIIFN